MMKAESEDAGMVENEKTFSVYKKGETIYKEGTRPFGVFCMNSGKAKIVTTGEDGREHIVRLAKPGDLLGYRSIFGGTVYYTSAIAIEECSVCFVPKDTFLKLIESNNDLAFEMLRLLSENLKETQTQLTNIAQKPVRERVAEALLFIKETYGFEEDQETINAQFSREDIANLVGTATETTIRLLSEFKKDNIISLKGRKIIIKDLPKLIKTANISD